METTDMCPLCGGYARGDHECGLDVRVGTLSGDERCHRCGGENVNWAAPSPLWNYVMRGNNIDGDPLHDDLVCPRCFMVLASEAGVDGLWRIEVEPEPDGLIETTPSGRRWDSAAWLWRDPDELLSWERELLGRPGSEPCPVCKQTGLHVCHEEHRR